MRWILVAFCLLAAAHARAAPPQPVQISGEQSLNGVFDPSLEFVPGSSEGWLAYSAVFGDVQPWGPHVETHLARTQDAGASFSFVSVVNASEPGTLSLIDGSTAMGVWNYEVSSLVYDPDDPGKEWKLFAHKIFRHTDQNFTTEQNEPAYSWIVLKTAPDPTGPWSAERALLSSGPLPPAPYNVIEFAINDLDETDSLDALRVYSEPGAFYRKGVLYLSLTGLVDTGSDRIVMLVSLDHGATWDYAGTPLTNADAIALGYERFDGSAIAEEAGQAFLTVTPDSPEGPVHDGVLIFAIDDLATGALARAGGIPVVHNSLPAIAGLPVERRGGQVDFHESSVTGILQPSLHFEAFPLAFRIYATRRGLSAEPVPATQTSARWLMILLMSGLSISVGRRRRAELAS